MGKLYLIQLDGRFYSCRLCHSHLANCDQLVSKAFHCRHGKAYLFNTVFPELEDLGTPIVCSKGASLGMQLFMADCKGKCQASVKQELAHDEAQKYKEGKFILERAKVVDGDGSGTDYYLDAHPVGSDAEDV